MTEHSPKLKEGLRSTLVSCAINGLLQEGKFLHPSDWEELRTRLQSIYRRATGETDAILEVKGPTDDNST